MTLLQRIVKNEAMKNDPPEIYGWRVFFLAASACFGGMLFGWDIGAIGGVLTLDPFKATYHLDGLSKSAQANLSANIVSTLQAGAFLGSILSWGFSDRFGQKPGLLVSSLFAIVGVIMQSAGQGQLAVMYIGRFVSGVGVGAASMLTPLYISENSPRAIRGGLTGMYQVFIATGTMMSFWINYGSALHLTGNAQYIVPLAVQMIPAVFLFIGIALNSESPRWLARQDNFEAATAVLSKVSNLPPDHPYIQMELADMRDQLEMERRLIGGASFMDLQKEMWLIPGNRNRALISIVLMICQQMTGTNAVNYYAPQIFADLGISGQNTGLFATGIYGVVKVVTCSVFLLFVADSLGRRRSLLWTSIAQGAALFIVGAYIRVDPPTAGAKIPPFGYVALVSIFLFAGFYQFGWGPCPWIYVSEIPTARLRSINVSLAASTQWLFNFVVARAVPSMLVNVGNQGYGTYFIFGSFCFSMFIFVWFFIPETKGMSLERMDQLFGITEALGKDIESDGHGHERAADPTDAGKAEEVTIERI